MVGLHSINGIDDDLDLRPVVLVVAVVLVEWVTNYYN
jgi:hypothetical protein